MEEMYNASELLNWTANGTTPIPAKPVPDNREREIINWMKVYIPPFLIVFGTIGNILSFLIFSRPALRSSHVAFYFRVVAISDTLALNMGLIPNWFRDMKIVNLFPPQNVVCRLKLYSKYVLADFPVWILVLMTIERFISVYSPLGVRNICTRRRVRFSVFVVVLAVLVINVPVLILFGGSKNGCFLIYPKLASTVWPLVDLTVYCLLPFLIMLTSNSAIIYLVGSRRREFIQDRVGNNLAAMTATLIVVCIVFIVLTLPFVVYSVLVKVYMHTKIPPWFNIFHIVASILRYVNNSVNFLLYSLSGKPFRRELYNMFCCKSSAKIEYQTATRVSVMSRSRSTYSRSSSLTH